MVVLRGLSGPQHGGLATLVAGTSWPAAAPTHTNFAQSLQELDEHHLRTYG